MRHAVLRSMLIAALGTGTAFLLQSAPRNGAKASDQQAASAASEPEQRAEPQGKLRQLARDTLSSNEAKAQQAIDRLRAAGPEGLAALMVLRVQQLSFGHVDQDQLARLEAAMDVVGAQHDCATSGLYWYTDLEQAQAAAGELGRPILSLRLLGRLTDELSCANSRFFRTTLYANAEVSQYLRDHYVLHWESVRPVPVVTIDFGDGRLMKTTLTGNSVHYVLDAQGRPIDALPGLYAPATFLRGLQQAESGLLSWASLPEAEQAARRMQYHRERQSAITAAWITDLQRLGISIADAPQDVPVPPAQGTGTKGTVTFRAEVAAFRAMGKGFVETRPLQLAFVDTVSRLRTATPDERWLQIAALHRSDAQFDAASLEQIRRQQPVTLIVEDSRTPDQRFEAMIKNFGDLVALDTVRNEYLYRRQIQEWLIAGSVADLNQLNERVYAELFLTPRSDPWLGLLAPDGYSALDNRGIVQLPAERTVVASGQAEE